MVMVVNAAAVTFPVTVQVDGSTTVLPITSAAIASFQTMFPDTIVNNPNPAPGSNTGINELCANSIDVANASRELSQGTQTCTSTIDDWIIAHDGIVPVINTASVTGVTNLTTAQLQGIYQCTITNWSAVGGPNAPIFVVGRDPTSGTYSSWNALLNITATTEQTCILGPPAHGINVLGNPDVQTAVAANAFSIGYVGHGFESFAGITDLTVNGVASTLQTVQNGTYPIARRLHMMTIQFASNTRLDTFARGINFVNYIVSATGQGFVTAASFFPLSAPQNIPPWDPDIDAASTADINDIVSIGQVWQQTQGPSHGGWIRQDANADGSVDVNDIVTVGAHWQGHWTRWTG
jgi:phosphate transport system substrate-binding protein